jgi:hypothetical protein
MTKAEYLKLRFNYEMSDAPIEVREEAIRKLDARWVAQNESMVEGGDLDDLT